MYTYIYIIDRQTDRQDFSYFVISYVCDIIIISVMFVVVDTSSISSIGIIRISCLFSYCVITLNITMLH